jgi:hypothetical protein
MRFDAVTVNVPTAATRVALHTGGGLNAVDRILWVRFKGRPNNTGTVYVGISDVTATNGYSLENNDDVGLTLDFRAYGGSILASDVSMDAVNNNDKIECALILE